MKTYARHFTIQQNSSIYNNESKCNYLLSTCGCYSMYWKDRTRWQKIWICESPNLIIGADSSHTTYQNITIVTDGDQSGLYMIRSRLPLSSASGPLLFTLYINNINLSTQCVNIHLRLHSFIPLAPSKSCITIIPRVQSMLSSYFRILCPSQYSHINID